MTSSYVIRLGRPDRLFCYGTLCIPAIMRRVSGMLPASLPARLPDYAVYSLTGLSYPGVVPAPGEQARGVLYQGLGRAQLARLDAYEGRQYRRVRVWVDIVGGERRLAWTYVLQPRYYHQRGQRQWSLAQFRGEQLHLYLASFHNARYGSHGRGTNQAT